MSRTKFIKETTEYHNWRVKNNLPVDINIFSVDKYIRDKWISENRHNELISYILDEWDNGDFNNYTDFIEEYEKVLLENNKSKEFIKLWKGIINHRVDYVWSYLQLIKSNSPYISNNEEVRLKYIKERQDYAIEGINRLIIGLQKLNEIAEIDKIESVKSSILKLERPKPRPSTDKRKMDESVFWELIDSSRKETESKYDFIDVLRGKLEAFKPNEIRNFHKIYLIKFNELNNWDNWALAYIVRQGCGDDEFDYFKAWVISKGLIAFNIIKNFEIENFKILLFSEDPQFEEFMYLAENVYEEKTNELMKHHKIKVQNIIGKEWDENDLNDRYSEICKMFEYR